jgi:hypothetical protein
MRKKFGVYPGVKTPLTPDEPDDSTLVAVVWWMEFG